MEFCWYDTLATLPYRPIYIGMLIHRLSSTQCSPVHQVEMHGISNKDIHLYLPHNNSSVYLTTTKVVWCSGQIANVMWSGWTTLQESVLSSPISVSWAKTRSWMGFFKMTKINNNMKDNWVSFAKWCYIRKNIFNIVVSDGRFSNWQGSTVGWVLITESSRLGLIPVWIVLKACKIVYAACPASCSVSMNGCMEGSV